MKLKPILLSNMKRKIITGLLAFSAIFGTVQTEVLAQVDYNRHPYYANTSYGRSVEYINRIRYVTDYVNGRQSPTRNSRVIASYFSHQTVLVLKEYYNNSDRYMWYYVYEPNRNQYGWVRGDLLE